MQGPKRIYAAGKGFQFLDLLVRGGLEERLAPSLDALEVGLGTAVARVAAIDQAIVLYSSMALVKDLMAIYGLRPELGQATVILARSIRNTYLAGLLQEVSE